MAKSWGGVEGGGGGISTGAVGGGRKLNKRRWGGLFDNVEYVYKQRYPNIVQYIIRYA